MTDPPRSETGALLGLKMYLGMVVVLGLTMLLAAAVMPRQEPTNPMRRKAYTRWWRETVVCAAAQGPEPPVVLVDSIPGVPIAVTDLRHRLIIVVRTYADSEWVIKHEMLHIAIGRPGHPVIPFYLCGRDPFHVFGDKE